MRGVRVGGICSVSNYETVCKMEHLPFFFPYWLKKRGSGGSGGV